MSTTTYRCSLCGYEEAETLITRPRWTSVEAGGEQRDICRQCRETKPGWRSRIHEGEAAGNRRWDRPARRAHARTRRPSNPRDDRLSRCAGYIVVARDGICGTVDTPLFAERGQPDYLVLRLGSRIRPRYPIVALTFVESIDMDRELVYLAVNREELATLPEHLPLSA